MDDEKKDFFVKGTLYNNQQEIVDPIFDVGTELDKNEIGSPFVIIVDEKQSKIKNKRQKDKVSLSVINAGNLFLASSRVENLFRELEINNVQFFDVTIRSSIGEINEYKILNITDKFDCVDFDLSELVLFSDGDIQRIKKLVIDSAKIPLAKKIFLLDKYPTQVIIVHDDLKQSIEKEGLTGFTFFKLEDAGKIY
jgi:hypothetical protein